MTYRQFATMKNANVQERALLPIGRHVSNRLYWALVLLLALLAAVDLFLPQGAFVSTLPAQDLPAPKPVMALAVAAMVLVLYGGLGWLGLVLARRLGFADLWQPGITNRQRLLLPALVGGATGLFFVLADTLFSRLRSGAPLPHPPFPTSLVASATAGIGEEIIFRLFFIAFWVWLVSAVLMKGRWQQQVFWSVAVVAALVFALGHLPSLMFLLGLQQITEIPMALLGEIILLNGVLSLLAAFYLRNYGFLAAVSVHFWADVVWHVLWGLVAGLL